MLKYVPTNLCAFNKLKKKMNNQILLVSYYINEEYEKYDLRICNVIPYDVFLLPRNVAVVAVVVAVVVADFVVVVDTVQPQLHTSQAYVVAR